jgi:probable HAF family extracellular repeat protein
MYTKENGFSQVIEKIIKRSFLKMNRIKVLCMIFIFSLFITTKYFSQNASFQGLGDLPGGVFESSAQSVSADGSVVVGSSMSESGAHAFIWTGNTGMVSLGNLPDSSFKQSWADNISADGKVIVGYGDPVGSGWDTYRGFIWTDKGGMREMGSLNSSTRSMAFNVSGDGSIVVGDGGPEAFRWTQETGIERLGVLPGKTNSRAIDISSDGSVIIGQSYSLPAWNDEDGFIWTQSDGMKAMASLTGGKYCMLLALSPDGSVIAGTTRSSSTYPAFFWTKDKGMVVIGHLSGRNTTHPTDMTPFGKIIVGGSFSGPTSGDAFIWDSTNGMRKLQTVLQTEYGLDLTGWTFQNASGITPNGNVIVGHGINPSGKQEAFRVVLNKPLTGMKENKNLIDDFELGQNYPNPFNPTTIISYQLPDAGEVNVSVYNLLGQKIKTLVDSYQNAGEHSFIWNGTDDSNKSVGSGIYFYSLLTNETCLQKKMLLLR